MAGEFALFCLEYNLEKAKNLLGFQKMMGIKFSDRLWGRAFELLQQFRSALVFLMIYEFSSIPDFCGIPWGLPP